jgi:hypothetical protein
MISLSVTTCRPGKIFLPWVRVKDIAELKYTLAYFSPIRYPAIHFLFRSPRYSDVKNTKLRRPVPTGVICWILAGNNASIKKYAMATGKVSLNRFCI